MTIKIFKNRHDGDVSAATPGSNFVPSNMSEQLFPVYFFLFLRESANVRATAVPARSGKGWMPNKG